MDVEKPAKRRSRKGEKAALMRQLGQEGAFGRKRPPRVGRKPRVEPTAELCREIIDRFNDGEFVVDICASDDRFPSDRAFRAFVAQDAELMADWLAAKAGAAEAGVAKARKRLWRTVKGPDGREDSAAAARDRAIAEFEFRRAAALDPGTWSMKSEHSLVGDATRPIVVQPRPMTPSQLSALLTEAERELGLPVLEGVSPRERLRNLELTSEPLPPPVYQLTHVRDSAEPEKGPQKPQDGFSSSDGGMGRAEPVGRPAGSQGPWDRNP